LDLAENMNLIVRRCFPDASIDIDQLHVHQLATEVLQKIRIKYRWNALDAENQAIYVCKRNKQNYIPEILKNWVTLKQLLAGSRYLLYKHEQNWTLQQALRANLLF
jgi:transposase